MTYGENGKCYHGCFSTHILTRRMTSYYECLCYIGYFSTHILTRRMTTCIQQNRDSGSIFNSHPHKEDDAHLFWCLKKYLFFNSHPHKEDDFRSCPEHRGFHIFQLTSSQGGWLPLQATSIISFAFQLTSSQGGWPSKFISCTTAFISTHILTRRMTDFDHLSFCFRIFQLTSSQGGWLFLFIPTIKKTYFNSHPHKEDDVPPSDSPATLLQFQLTSSQGGWRASPTVPSVLSIFQLTSSQGGWPAGNNGIIEANRFQLTSSQGGWLFSSERITYIFYFNSHPHKEDDGVT